MFHVVYQEAQVVEACACLLPVTLQRHRRRAGRHAPGREGVGDAAAEAGHVAHGALQLHPSRLAGRQRRRQPLRLRAALLDRSS